MRLERGRHSCRMNGGLGVGEELLDLGDGLRVVLVADRVDACVTRAGHACFGVVEEGHLTGRNVQAGADARVDARSGLLNPTSCE
jgi:hypothetical protein